MIPDDETFRVRLRKAKSIAFSGPCLLEILRDFERNLFHIAMFTEEELPRLVVKWQIDHIRQYGSNNMAFKFESGRLECVSGGQCGEVGVCGSISMALKLESFVVASVGRWVCVAQTAWPSSWSH